MLTHDWQKCNTRNKECLHIISKRQIDPTSYQLAWQNLMKGCESMETPIHYSWDARQHFMEKLSIPATQYFHSRVYSKKLIHMYTKTHVQEGLYKYSKHISMAYPLFCSTYWVHRCFLCRMGSPNWEGSQKLPLSIHEESLPSSDLYLTTTATIINMVCIKV